MKILIAGTNGKIGSLLTEILSQSHDVTGMSRQELDITDFVATKEMLHTLQPDLVMNAAAWTDVDGCARDPERAMLINGYGAQNLSVAAQSIGSIILQLSSNEVFDGKANRPYYEYDALNPVNPYGYSKMVGERSVVQTNPKHYIVRTSWNIARGGRNFIHAILDRAREGKPLRVVIDEVANPTYNDDLVAAIAQLIDTERFGTYHLCNEGQTSRYGFARHVLDVAGYTHVEIEAISRHQWQRPSSPPVYTSLANTTARQLGITLRDWQSAVEDFIQKEALHSVSD